MPPELLRGLITIAFGAIAGGLTNTVAVWMLFHPYEAPRLGRFRLRFLHGAIPKNQARLAEAVGRTVGNRLLTHEDLEGVFSNLEFRSAFEDRLGRFLVQLLETDRKSLREALPPELATALEEILTGGANLLEDRLGAWINSPDFAELVQQKVEEILARLSEHPVNEVVTPAREEAVAAAVEGWARQAIDRDSFRSTIQGYVDRAVGSFLRDDRTFEEILPAGLVGSLERALSSYLPIAVRKLGGILEDPDARERLESTIHELFQKFLRDLRFHQRVVAKLVVTEETLERVLETLEEEGAEHLSEMLRDPSVQDATARRVNAAVVDFLQRPITTVLGHPGDESVEAARDTIVAWIVELARDPDAFEFLIERLRRGIERAAEGSWGELFDRMPPDRIGGALVSAARSSAARKAYRDAMGHVLRRLLERPIGRPSDWLPSDSAKRMQRAVSDPLWDWLQTQVPEVVSTLDVSRRVEEKVRSFPTPKMEEIVRRVTDRELRMIVRLGYVLGGLIGTVLVVVDALLG